MARLDELVQSLTVYRNRVRFDVGPELMEHHGPHTRLDASIQKPRIEGQRRREAGSRRLRSDMNEPVIPSSLVDRLDRRGLQAEGIPQGLVAFPALARYRRVPDHGVLQLRSGVPREWSLRLRRQPHRRGDQMQREHHTIPIANDLRAGRVRRDIPVTVGLTEPCQSAIVVSQPDVRPESHLHRGVRERARVPRRPPCPRKMIQVLRVLRADGNLDRQGVQVDDIDRGDFDIEPDHPVEFDVRLHVHVQVRCSQTLFEHDLIEVRRHLIDRFRGEAQAPAAGDRRQSYGCMQYPTARRGHRFDQTAGSEPVIPPPTGNLIRSAGMRRTLKRSPGCGYSGIEPGARAPPLGLVRWIGALDEMRDALATPAIDEDRLQLTRACRHLSQVEHDRTTRRLVEIVDSGPHERLTPRTVPDPELDGRPSRYERIADRNDRDVQLVRVESRIRAQSDLAW